MDQLTGPVPLVAAHRRRRRWPGPPVQAAEAGSVQDAVHRRAAPARYRPIRAAPHRRRRRSRTSPSPQPPWGSGWGNAAVGWNDPPTPALRSGTGPPTYAPSSDRPGTARRSPHRPALSITSTAIRRRPRGSQRRVRVLVSGRNSPMVSPPGVPWIVTDPQARSEAHSNPGPPHTTPPGTTSPNITTRF